MGNIFQTLGNVFQSAQSRSNNLLPALQTSYPPSISFATAIVQIGQQVLDQTLFEIMMDFKLIGSTKCGFCLKEKLLLPTVQQVKPQGNADVFPVQDLPEEAVLCQVGKIGTACFSCAEVIFGNTEHLLSEGKPNVDTPFHEAAKCQSVRTLFNLILVAKKDGSEKVLQVLKRVNHDGETALHQAIASGNELTVKLLLWVAPELATECNETSAVYKAVSLKHRIIAKMLHDWVPNVSYVGPEGQNALHAAVVHDKDMVSTIISWDASFSQKKDAKGNLPLHLASLEVYHILSDRILLDNYKRAAYTSNHLGLFPLHLAASKDQVGMIRLLIDNCPNCIFLRDKSGKTMLHHAVLNRSYRTVDYVYDHWPLFSTILNDQDCDGHTALHVAVKIGALQAVLSLLNIPDIMVDLLNKDKQSALDLAMINCEPFRKLYWVERDDVYIKLSLELIGARCNSYIRRSRLDPEKEKAESENLCSCSDKLAMVSVLITSCAFASSFDLPGDTSTDKTNCGMFKLAGGPLFSTLVITNWMGFICSAAATLCAMLSAMPLMQSKYRRRYVILAHFFTKSSVTALVSTISLLGSISLVPSSKYSAIAIWWGSPLVFIIVNLCRFRSVYRSAGPVMARHRTCGIFKFLWIIVLAMLMELWPLCISIIWMASSYRAAKTWRVCS